MTNRCPTTYVANVDFPLPVRKKPTFRLGGGGPRFFFGGGVRICVKRAPFVKLAFLQQNGAFLGPNKGDFPRKKRQCDKWCPFHAPTHMVLWRGVPRFHLCELQKTFSLRFGPTFRPLTFRPIRVVLVATFTLLYALNSYAWKGLILPESA